MENTPQFPCFLKRDANGRPEFVIIQDTEKGEILSLNVTPMNFEEIGKVMVPNEKPIQ